jgi:AcrR family transcriptional regulator
VPRIREASKTKSTAKSRSQRGEAVRATSEATSANQLLEAASKILAKRPNIDVSFSEIAETSGLNSALIKYYFGGKDGLLLALVRRDATVALRQLDTLLSMNIPPEQKMRLHVAGVINTYFKYPYLNRLIHALLANEDERIPDEIADFFVKPLVDAQIKMMKEGTEAGVFRPIDPTYFYYSIIGACDHIFFGRVTRKSVFGIGEITPTMRDEYINFVSDMTLRMLTKN